MIKADYHITFGVHNLRSSPMVALATGRRAQPVSGKHWDGLVAFVPRCKQLLVNIRTSNTLYEFSLKSKTGIKKFVVGFWHNIIFCGGFCVNVGSFPLCYGKGCEV